MWTFTKDTALSGQGRGTAWHVWINKQHGRGMLCVIRPLVGWWTGRVFLVLWSKVEDSLPVFCIRSLTNASPNCQCDNFELRRENDKAVWNGTVQKMEKWLLCPPACASGNTVGLSHTVRFLHISHLSVLVLYYSQLQSFSMLFHCYHLKW
jgi:hypothetical protein